MKITRSWVHIVAAMTAACCASAVSAQGVGRLEIHAIPSVTVSNKQFLTGDRYGKPVIIGGELRLPRTATQKFPMVILISRERRYFSSYGSVGARTELNRCRGIHSGLLHRTRHYRYQR